MWVEWQVESEYKEEILLLLEELKPVILDAARWLQGMSPGRREVLSVDVNFEAHMGRVPYTLEISYRADGKIWMSLWNNDKDVEEGMVHLPELDSVKTSDLEAQIDGMVREMGFLELHDLIFEKVCNIEPERDSFGRIFEYRPQGDYINPLAKLHRYGDDSFCRFRIPSEERRAGVYLIYSGDSLMYVGEVDDLAKRFNQGYGSIAPRACYEGGQETNCRVNKLIMGEANAGRKTTLYFHESDDRFRLESELIDSYHPPWNRSGGRGSSARKNAGANKMGTKYDSIGEYLKKQTGSRVTLSLAEVENVLGFPLPDSAYQHRPWWANGGHSQCEGWMRAGWMVDKVQVGKNVTFIRVG